MSLALVILGMGCLLAVVGIVVYVFFYDTDEDDL